MNNQDYENKKRECWKEICQEHGIKGDAYFIGDAFGRVWDRAYALGKQEKDVDTVIKGWVAIDEALNECFLHTEKPIADTEYHITWESMGKMYLLDKELFPDMTPNSDPEPVEIIIKRKKK